jgi:hypothetical protein
MPARFALKRLDRELGFVAGGFPPTGTEEQNRSG